MMVKFTLVTLAIVFALASAQTSIRDLIPEELRISLGGEITPGVSVSNYVTTVSNTGAVLKQSCTVKYDVVMAGRRVAFSVSVDDDRTTSIIKATGTQDACTTNVMGITGFSICSATLTLEKNYSSTAASPSVKSLSLAFTVNLSQSTLKPLMKIIPSNTAISASMGFVYAPNRTAYDWTFSFTVSLDFGSFPIKNGQMTVSSTYASDKTDWSLTGAISFTVAILSSTPTFTATATYTSSTKTLDMSGSATGTIDLGSGFIITSASVSASVTLGTDGTTSVLNSLSFSGSFTASSGALSKLSKVLSSATFTLKAEYAAGAWLLKGSVGLTFGAGSPVSSGILSVSCSGTSGSFVFMGTVSITVTIGPSTPTFTVSLTYTTSNSVLVLSATAQGTVSLSGGFTLTNVGVTVNFDLTTTTAITSLSVYGTFTASGGSLVALTKIMGSGSFALAANYYSPSTWTLESSILLTFTSSPVRSATFTIGCGLSNNAFVFMAKANVIVDIAASTQTFAISVVFAVSTGELSFSASLVGCVSIFGGFSMCETTLDVKLVITTTSITFVSLSFKGKLRFTSGGAQTLGGFLSSAELAAEVTLSLADNVFTAKVEISLGMNMESTGIITAGTAAIKAKYKPTKMTVEITVTLTAKLGTNTANYPVFWVSCSYDLLTTDLTISGGMQNCWANPFGITGLQICDVTIGVGINMAALLATAGMGAFSSFTVGGGVILGTAPRNKTLVVYIAIDFTTPLNNAFLASLPNTRLDLFDMIDFGLTVARAAGIALPSIPSGAVFVMYIENLLFKFSAKTIVIAGETFTPGIAVKCTIGIFGLVFDGAFEIGTSGVSAYLSIPSMNVANLLKIYRSSTDKVNGPYGSFYAVWSPSIKFEVNCSGYVEVLGFGLNIVLSITTSRFYFEATSKFLALFDAFMTFNATYGSIANLAFTVTAELKNDLFSAIRSAAKAAIQSYADSATKAISDATASVNAEKAKFDKASADLLAKQKEVDAAKATLASKQKDVDSAQTAVNNACPSSNCGSVCSPTVSWDSCYTRTASWCTGCSRCGGWSCRWRGCCTDFGGDCVGASITNACGTRITDPVCLASNTACAAVRATAEATLSTAKLALSAAQDVVNVGNAALDVLAATVRSCTGLLNAATAVMDAANAVNAVGAMVATKMTNFLLGGVFDITRVYFSATLSVANGGNMLANISVSWLGAAATTYELTVNFKDIAAFANTVWTKVKEAVAVVDNGDGSMMWSQEELQTRDEFIAARVALIAAPAPEGRPMSQVLNNSTKPFKPVMPVKPRQTIDAIVEDLFMGEETTECTVESVSKMIKKADKVAGDDQAADAAAKAGAAAIVKDFCNKPTVSKVQVREFLTNTRLAFDRMQGKDVRKDEALAAKAKADAEAEFERAEGKAAKEQSDRERLSREAGEKCATATEKVNDRMQEISEKAMARIAELKGDASDDEEIPQEKVDQIARIRSDMDNSMKSLESSQISFCKNASASLLEQSRLEFLQFKSVSLDSDIEELLE